MTVDVMRQQFEAAGVPCAAEVVEDEDRATLLFEPTFNLVYLTLGQGLVRRADLRSDYRRQDRLGDNIIGLLVDFGYDYRDEDE